MSDRYEMEVEQMNYTKTIRNYINENKGTIFDMGYEFKERFYMVASNTFIVVIKRLEKEGILKLLYKGTYLIVADGVDEDDAIANFYASKGNGMFLGYKLFNKLGLSTYKTSNYEILTRRIGTTTKHIKDNKIIKYDTMHFDSVTQSIITVLEIVKHGYIEMEEHCDAESFLSTVRNLCKKYREEEFKEVLVRTNYPLKIYRMYVRLLDMFNVPNKAMEIVNRGIKID